MDTTDLTNRIQDEQEAEELAEAKRATEEDHGFDDHNAFNGSVKKMEAEEKNPDYHKGGEGLTEEQEYNFRQQMIKEMYARFYEFGLKPEQVRGKLDKMSMFFGNIGAVSNMSNEEIGIVCYLLQYMKLTNYKFSR